MAGRAVSTAALIHSEGRFLFVKRGNAGSLAGKWELPGGKADPGERARDALARELREELGVESAIGRLQGVGSFEHRGKRFELRCYEAKVAHGSIRLTDHVDSTWRTLTEALLLDLADSDRRLIERLVGRTGAARVGDRKPPPRRRGSGSDTRS